MRLHRVDPFANDRIELRHLRAILRPFEAQRIDLGRRFLGRLGCSSNDSLLPSDDFGRTRCAKVLRQYFRTFAQILVEYSLITTICAQIFVIDKVCQNFSRSNGRQLIRVADEHEPRHFGVNRLE